MANLKQINKIITVNDCGFNGLQCLVILNDNNLLHCKRDDKGNPTDVTMKEREIDLIDKLFKEVSCLQKATLSSFTNPEMFAFKERKDYTREVMGINTRNGMPYQLEMITGAYVLKKSFYILNCHGQVLSILANNIYERNENIAIVYQTKEDGTGFYSPAILDVEAKEENRTELPGLGQEKEITAMTKMDPKHLKN